MKRGGRIDYRMARRAVLADVREGTRPVDEVCDAHPDLVRAGQNIGEDLDDDCPICDEGRLRGVTYGFYGRGRERTSGRVIQRDSLMRLVQRYGRVNVYTVEVCPSCHWNHLLEAYWVAVRAAG